MLGRDLQWGLALSIAPKTQESEERFVRNGKGQTPMDPVGGRGRSGVEGEEPGGAVGFVADEDKAALISGAEALLFPSLYEGFGFPVLEGNICETPVLAANSSSLPEIADEAALLIDPLDTQAISDGIGQIVADMALREALVEAGRVNARRFKWQTAARRVLTTLEEAAA